MTNKISRRKFLQYGVGALAGLTLGTGGLHLFNDYQQRNQTLANKLLDLYPHMRCLFMSGYTADIIGKSGILDSEIDFIQKPFSIDILSKKIKEIFDR